MMHITVKGPNGNVEKFDNVNHLNFAQLRRQIIERFNLLNDFSLFLGDRELPAAGDLVITDKGLGIVSGDRLRILLHDKPLNDAEVPTESACAKADEAVPSAASAGGNISDELAKYMKESGFERMNNDPQRMQFRHPRSALIVDLDVRIYEDMRNRCFHITPSIVHPSRRCFLNPVVINEGDINAAHIIATDLIAAVRLNVLGHDNPFLRLLSRADIADSVFKYLTAKSILLLEQTCSEGKRICSGAHVDRVWKSLLAREFGDDVGRNDGETFRDCYKRKHIERQEARKRQEQQILEFEHRFEEPSPLRIPPHRPYPYRPYPWNPDLPGPLNPDPDMPHGPFHPEPSNPFIPDIPRFPRPQNPFDPFSGSEIMPSRPPSRPFGQPRQIPRGFPPYGGFGGGGII